MINFQNLTVKEAERIFYIEQHPQHSLIAALLTRADRSVNGTNNHPDSVTISEALKRWENGSTSRA